MCIRDRGYTVLATSGTARKIQDAGVPVQVVKKIIEGQPNLIDHMKNDGVDLILNTPSGKGARTDEGTIRATSVQHGIPCITTIQAAEAVVEALQALRGEAMGVEALQDRFQA